MEGWANFDFVGADESEWISKQKVNEIEGFKFYQQLGYSKLTPVKFIAQKIAQWRVEKSAYGFPIEKKLIRWLKPKTELS